MSQVLHVAETQTGGTLRVPRLTREITENLPNCYLAATSAMQPAGNVSPNNVRYQTGRRYFEGSRFHEDRRFSVTVPTLIFSSLLFHYPVEVRWYLVVLLSCRLAGFLHLSPLHVAPNYDGLAGYRSLPSSLARAIVVW